MLIRPNITKTTVTYLFISVVSKVLLEIPHRISNQRIFKQENCKYKQKPLNVKDVEGKNVYYIYGALAAGDGCGDGVER